MKKSFFLIAILTLSFTVYGQRYGNSGNTHIGVTGGYSYLTINSDQFTATPKGGFNAGFEQRGMLYNKSDLVYGMSFNQSKFVLPGRSSGIGALHDVEYTAQYFQVFLLGSYRAISDHLNFDFGPVFQLNGKLKYEELDKLSKIEGTNITVDDLSRVSQVNVYLTAGITGGAEKFRIGLHYHYGVTNFFGKVNDTDNAQLSGVKFKGNLGLITARAILYL